MKHASGVKKLGEGFHGIGYTIENFYKLIKPLDIKQVNLFTVSEDDLVLSDSDDIVEFVKFISKLKHVIAKVFKSQFLLTFSAINADIKDEIEINRRIVELYKKEAEKYLTIAPIHGFRKHAILGCVISTKSGTRLHVTFGHMCNNAFKVRSPAFMKDLFKSIIILQKNNTQHNDIKPDNIVLCGDMYKLIDWGQAGPIDKMYIGDFIFSSPIKWYIRGYTEFISRKLMNVRAGLTDKAYSRSPYYIEQYARLTKELDMVISKNSDRAKLLDEYKKSFDIFMVGMTFLHMIYKYKLNYTKYKPLVERLTSLLDPITDPDVAINEVNKYL